jgi:hypothetical protein
MDVNSGIFIENLEELTHVLLAGWSSPAPEGGNKSPPIIV